MLVNSEAELLCGEDDETKLQEERRASESRKKGDNGQSDFGVFYEDLRSHYHLIRLHNDVKFDVCTEFWRQWSGLCCFYDDFGLDSFTELRSPWPGSGTALCIYPIRMCTLEWVSLWFPRSWDVPRDLWWTYKGDGTSEVIDNVLVLLVHVV